MDKVAIVILNWNGEAVLRRFLPAVLSHSLGPRASVEGTGELQEGATGGPTGKPSGGPSEEAKERKLGTDGDLEGVSRYPEEISTHSDVAIYLADNGSTDGSVSMVRELFPMVKVIAMDQNRGFAEGYNVALRSIEAQYVVLLNSDVEPKEGWLTPLVNYMDAHPEVAACQPKLLSWHDPSHFEYAGACGGFIDRYGYPYCRGRIMGTVEQDHGQYDSIHPVLWATGAALFIRLEDYRKVGGLDGRFFAHCEEIDLCWRLRARGRGVACVPQSVVYHVGAATLRRENPRKTYLNFRNNLLMLYKNLPDDELHSVMRLRWWLDRLAALKFLLCGQGANARAVLQARRDFRHIRPDFEADRRNNLELATYTTVEGRTSGSILWHYYARRQKTFDALTP